MIANNNPNPNPAPATRAVSAARSPRAIPGRRGIAAVASSSSADLDDAAVTSDVEVERIDVVAPVRPHSILEEDASPPPPPRPSPRRRRNKIAMIAAGIGLGIASASVPMNANAARARKAPVVAAAAAAASQSSQSFSPNLFSLPPSASEAIDSASKRALVGVKGFLEKCDENINDPWHAEDVWLIFVWHWLSDEKRRKAFHAFLQNTLKPDDEPPTPFEESYWHFVHGPMKVIFALWVTLYMFDNLAWIGRLLELSVGLPQIFVNQFDRGMYALAAGCIAGLSANEYFPRVLRSKFGVTNTSTELLLTRFAIGVITFTTVLVAALLFGLPPKSLLGFGGIGGLTFGLAAKDLISNYLGGVMLAVMKPFSPGEKVYLMPVNGRFRGTNEPDVGGYLVKEIGWYQTTLIPKDTRPTTVPNGFFLGSSVINISRQTQRVIGGELRVRYDDAECIPRLTEEIAEYLRNHPDIESNSRPIRVHMRTLMKDASDGSLRVRIECHCNVVKKDAFLKTQQAIFMDIWAIQKRLTTGPAWPVLVSPSDYNPPWGTGAAAGADGR